MNVSVGMAQTGGKTKKKGNGFVGKVNNAARAMTAVCTMGVSNLFWKKSKGSEREKFKNEAFCVCQNCGNSWRA